MWLLGGVTCVTCGVMPGWQTDGFLEEAELRVVKPECLVDNMRCWLHVHLADGHRFPIFCFKCNLWRKGQRYQQHATPLHKVRYPLQWNTKPNYWNSQSWVGSSTLSKKCQSWTRLSVYKLWWMWMGGKTKSMNLVSAVNVFVRIRIHSHDNENKTKVQIFENFSLTLFFDNRDDNPSRTKSHILKIAF